jgi:hypothetical protein
VLTPVTEQWLVPSVQLTEFEFAILSCKGAAMIGRQGLLKSAACLIAGVVFGLVVEHALFQLDSDRRYALYNIRRELKFSLSRAEVEAIIARHQTPFIHIHRGDGIALSVKLGGLARHCELSFAFEGDKLTTARIRGEDGPHDRFGDAPPDLESTLQSHLR